MPDDSLGTWNIWRFCNVASVGHSASYVEVGSEKVFAAQDSLRVIETLAGYSEQQVNEVVKQWRAMRWTETTDYVAERIV